MFYLWLMVWQNVLLGLQVQGKKGLEVKVDVLIDCIGLQVFSEVWLWQLFGGMVQCVVLVCVLLNELCLLLFDELLGKFDLLICISMQWELIVFWQQQGYISLLVIYDIEEVLLLCEWVLVMLLCSGWIIVEFVLLLVFFCYCDNLQLLQYCQDILCIFGQEVDW